ncbi:MAG: hypothetical protein HZB53_06350 [Chloroflexi bacterium]|nr:hypothetical protein [Chloroflexota bacterium]
MKRTNGQLKGMLRWTAWLVLAALLASCGLMEDVPPVAHAGSDQSVKLGAPITLDASKSREIDGGSIVEYRWVVTGVPKGKEDFLNRVLSTGKDPKASVQLPSDDGALGVWTIEVFVTDDGGNRAANDVRITLVK